MHAKALVPVERVVETFLLAEEVQDPNSSQTETALLFVQAGDGLGGTAGIWLWSLTYRIVQCVSLFFLLEIVWRVRILPSLPLAGSKPISSVINTLKCILVCFCKTVSMLDMCIFETLWKDAWMP